MTTEHSDRPALAELVVADPAHAWSQAGFAAKPDGAVWLGGTAVRPLGPHETSSRIRGIIGWTLHGFDVTEGLLDGLPTQTAGPDVLVDTSDGFVRPSTPDGNNGPPKPAPTHPNGAVGIDHVVVSTPDLQRTISACEAVGLRCRRIRDAGTPEQPLRQAFFRLGPVVLEVVGGPHGSGATADEEPARWFGLAVDVADLDAAATLLGNGLGPIKGAVQAGRRIATLRHREFGLSVAVALMDDHGDR